MAEHSGSRPGGAVTVAAVAALCASLAVAGCGDDGRREPARSAATRAEAVATTTPAAVPAVPPRMVRWRGPVEHIFFHPLVVQPARAFHGPQGRGFRDYMVTAGEFRRILGELYRNRWTLVDIRRAVDGTVRVPAGRRPLVISVDDLNFYDYMRAVGPQYRLVLDRAGRVAVELRDRHGRHPRVSRTAEIVPLLDDFVATHPAFSADGAKGVVALTGYEGTLGWRTNVLDAPDIARRRASARRVAARMRATGWRFASHSWGHLNHAERSTAVIRGDATRWRDQVRPIVGPTDIYIYPFGAVPPAATLAMLHRDFGFRVFCSIDARPMLRREGGVTLMARRHIDGLAFAGQVRALRPLFSVSRVIDRRARG